MALTTSQLRQVWAPACENAHGAEIVAMWGAIDDVMVHHRYVPRPGVTSAANCRPVTGGSGHSIHSFYDRGRRYTFRSSAPGQPVTIAVAAALDVNSDKNPYGPRLVTDMPEAMWRDWLRVRTNNGRQLLVWGGLFSPNHDAMHLQPGCSPADIRTGIDRSTLPAPAPTPIPPEDPDMYDQAAEKRLNDRIDALTSLVARQATAGGWSYAGTDLNAVIVDPMGRMVQAVYFGAGEERLLGPKGLVPTNGVACPMVRDVGGVTGRVDVFGFYPGGGFCIATFDPKNGKWGSADFGR